MGLLCPSGPAPDPVTMGRVFQQLPTGPFGAEAVGSLAWATLGQAALTCDRWPQMPQLQLRPRPQQAEAHPPPKIPPSCALGEMQWSP